VIAERELETLPANLQAEKTLLGAVLMEPLLCNEAAQYLGAEDFFLDSHRRIYGRMLELAADGRPIDIVTLCDVMTKRRELDSVGGPGYLSSLIDGVPAMPSVMEYAKMVRDKSRLRGLISASTAMIARAQDGGSADELLSELQSKVSDLVGRGTKRGALELRDIGVEWLNDLHADRKVNRDTTLGLTTSIEELDKLTTGIRKNELWVIGARPGVGKSALARQIALANASRGKRVVVFTIEMKAKQVLGCAVALYGGGQIPYYKLRDARELTPAELLQVQEWTAEMCKLPLVLDDSSPSAAELAARGRLHAAKGADLFIVDYLQRVGGYARQSTLERVATASNTVCELAKSTGVPVIALSQLRKAPNGQEDREPTAEDLKETGEILQDAATVLLLHRPIEKEPNFRSRPAVMLVPKQRFGDSDARLDLIFNKRTLSFQESAL
jgi:replicative DNA helicase